MTEAYINANMKY